MTTPTPAPHEPAAPPTTPTPTRASAPGLAARAEAARALAARHDPGGFARRRHDHRSWARRQHTAAALAHALGVPVQWVHTSDDPDRGYGIAGHYHGDLYTLTDPTDTRAWRFIPDPLADHAHSWLLLGPCPHCPSTRVPLAHIAGLADLGDHLHHHHHDPDSGNHGGETLPEITRGDPAHHPDCRHAAGRLTASPGRARQAPRDP